MTDSDFNLGTVVDDAKKVVLDPIGFFKTMPTSGGYVNPLIFVVVMSAVSGLVIALFSLIGLAKVNPVIGSAATLSALIVMPIFGVIGSFIGAVILFVIWKLMGSSKDYETAYRCFAYGFAVGPIIAALAIIPYVATIVGALWRCFLLYVASVQVHELKETTSKVVFGILAALLLFMGVSSEHATRNVQAHFEQFEQFEDMSAEEAGEKVGEFLKGLEKAAREAEKAGN